MTQCKTTKLEGVYGRSVTKIEGKIAVDDICYPPGSDRMGEIVVEAGQNILGIDDRGDGIELGAGFDVVVGEEGLRDRRRVGEARGFDQDGVELVFALHQI